MEIRERLHANILVLRPVGRIDSRNSGELQAPLLAALRDRTKHCIIDLGAVEFISTAGLRAILTAVRAKPPTALFALAAASEVVAEILKIARFSYILPIYGTVAEAAAALLLPAHGPAAAAPAQPLPTADAAAHAAAFAVRFWGARGALPAPLGAAGLRAKLRAAVLSALAHNPETPEAVDAFIDEVLPFSVHGTFAGNSSCVAITAGGAEDLLCDLGSGAYAFAQHAALQPGTAFERSCHVFLSDLRWDHIIGFPFLAAARARNSRIRIHSCQAGIEAVLQGSRTPPLAAAATAASPAGIEFVTLEPDRAYAIAGCEVTPFLSSADTGSCGYRFARAGKAIVYSAGAPDYPAPRGSFPAVEACRDADLLIQAAPRPLADHISAEDAGGHADNIVAVELAQAARAKRLALFHYDPAYDDAMIERALAEAIHYQQVARRDHRVEILAAYDGLELQI